MLVLQTGSNIGSRLKNLALARHFIQYALGPLDLVSSVYESEPWGVKDQPAFLNQVFTVNCDKSAEAILSEIQEIEHMMGRTRIRKWGERIIDIDILFLDEQIIEKANLKIPHPEITNRNFVLTPLNEILSDFIHPVLHKSINELMAECKDECKVLPYTS